MKYLLIVMMTLLLASCSSTTQDLKANEENESTEIKVGERIRVLQHYKNAIFGDHFPGVITEDADVVKVEVKKSGIGTEIYIVAVKEGVTRIAYVPVQPHDPNDIKRKKDFLSTPTADIRSVKVVE